MIYASLNARANYFQIFEDNTDVGVTTLNDSNKSGFSIDSPSTWSWQEEARKTGELFPGRSQIRPNIDFGSYSASENPRSCRKNFFSSRSHSPGIFTVQCVCVCQYPKLLGVSVMKKTESGNTALSILLLRFRNLTRVCYHDNGCNMPNFIVLRVPWVNNNGRLVCDKFYFAVHTYNAVFDPDSYIVWSEHVASGEESIN